MVRTLILSLAVAFSLAAAPAARAQSDQQQAVNDAVVVVQHLLSGSDPAAVQARSLLHDARAVLIVPTLVKGGFFFGAQGGTGVLLAKGSKGWSNPAFYAMGAASFGLQIGLEVSKVMLIIMNDRALKAIMSSEVKLGAEAGLAVATIGAGAEASTTAAGGADIVAVADSKGLFGGIAIEGGVLSPRDEWDADYYGHPVSVSDILIARKVSNKGAEELRKALRRF
jgi:SH3 domain-containing YSC84-like protein 1